MHVRVQRACAADNPGISGMPHALAFSMVTGAPGNRRGTVAFANLKNF